MTVTKTPRISVAAGVLLDADGRVLVAQRHAGGHQGGWWEFPGGKINERESAYEALVRELREELTITVTGAEPLLVHTHEYPERTVVLHFFRVSAFAGTPVGAEGQPIKWLAIDRLADEGLLPADLPVVDRLLNSEAANPN
jgi:8-oxo-dGTP diphosphatase